MRSIITAIYDKVSEETTGPLMVFKNEAPAIRTFRDIATDKNTMVCRHLHDYELHQLGTINGLLIEKDHRVLLTGEQLAAALNTETQT